MRKGKSINTYSGVEFWPLDPKKEEIKIKDIAHALSLMCRANGHFKYFYSVAQHSLYCYYEAKNRNLSKKVQLACLLHDASEAYLSDITRPVKACLNKYLEAEEVLQNFIYKHYGVADLTKEEEALVKEIDDAMLNYEMTNLLGVPKLNDLKLVKDYDLSFRNMKEVEDEFIDIINSYGIEE